MHLMHKHQCRVLARWSSTKSSLLYLFSRYLVFFLCAKTCMVTDNNCIPENIFLMRHQHTVCAHFSSTCHCYAYCVFFSSFPHAVPKRALQRDKYGSQTKHCLSNVIDFGFTFLFTQCWQRANEKKKSFPLEVIALFYDKGPRQFRSSCC